MTAPPRCWHCDQARPLDPDGHCAGCATRSSATCACGAPFAYPRDERGRITVTCANGHEIARADA